MSHFINSSIMALYPFIDLTLAKALFHFLAQANTVAGIWRNTLQWTKHKCPVSPDQRILKGFFLRYRMNNIGQNKTLKNQHSNILEKSLIVKAKSKYSKSSNFIFQWSSSPCESVINDWHKLTQFLARSVALSQIPHSLLIRQAYLFTGLIKNKQNKPNFKNTEKFLCFPHLNSFLLSLLLLR